MKKFFNEKNKDKTNHFLTIPRELTQQIVSKKNLSEKSLAALRATNWFFNHLLRSEVLENYWPLGIHKIIITWPSTLILTRDGRLFWTGFNKLNHLGQGYLGIRKFVKSFTKVKFPEKINHVITNGDSTILLSDTNSMWVVGSNSLSAIDPNGKKIVRDFKKALFPSKDGIDSVVLSGSGLFVITNTGKVWGLGCNTNNRLGLNNNSYSSIGNGYYYVNDFTQVILPNSEYVICAIAEDWWYSYLLTSQGNVLVCGYNREGELGLGHANVVNAFAQIKLPNNEFIISIKSVGDFCRPRTFLLTNKGRLLTQDLDKNGEFQNTLKKTPENYTFSQLKFPNKERITTNSFYSIGALLLVTDEGNVLAWGSNSLGELGLGDTKTVNQLTQVKLPNNEFIIAATMCNGYSYLLTKKGSVFVSGVNYDDFKDKHYNLFTQLDLPCIRRLVTEDKEIFFITDKGDVFFRGENRWGQRGLKSEGSVKSVTLVPPPKKSWKPLTLNEKQRESINSLIEKAKKTNQSLKIAPLLANLFLAFKKSEVSFFSKIQESTIAIEIANVLINIKHNDYIDCLRCITLYFNKNPKSLNFLMKKDDGIDFNLLCLWKSLYLDEIKEKIMPASSENVLASVGWAEKPAFNLNIT